MKPKINDNHSKNRIELRFSKKPSEDVRKTLFVSGFRYQPRGNYWYISSSVEALTLLHQLFDHGEQHHTSSQNEPSHEEGHLDRVVAYLHDWYAQGKRPTQSYIKRLGDELGIHPGRLWEAVELSWLLWYRMLYHDNLPFDVRLERIIHFWDHVQPTYAYSDSSKEIYKQYSTPCPIGAIVAQYTRMDEATSIFEPSAGNGLLVLGAKVHKTHVNEIDTTRLDGLHFQRFARITTLNGTQPFPEEMTKAYDVVVTNPPFTRWEENHFDRALLVRRYFNNQIGLIRFLRLEHVMAGLALHCLKDHGRAAVIIMGHVTFDENGMMAIYRPFFNWLFRYYNVDDVINLNSFQLYHRQGAVAKVMLILIAGRKPQPHGVAPQYRERPWLSDVVNSFTGLWERVRIHWDYDVLIRQLQFALL